MAAVPGLLEGLGAATELWCVTRREGDTVRFVEVSPSLVELLGYGEEELLARPWVEFLFEHEVERLLKVSAAVRQTSDITKTTVRYRRKDRRLAWLEFHSVLRGGYVFSSIRDLTDLKKLQAEARIALCCTRELAAKDALTGLYNRRLFDELFELELRRAARTLLPLSLLSLDLDHFKQLNDTFGHDAGDRALVAVADLIRQTVRAEDLAFRVGGEELCLLLPRCGTEGGMVVAEKVLGAVRSCTRVAGVRMTVSAGLVTFPDHGTEIPVLSKAADVALYAAKRAGRDRVCTPEEATVPA